MAKIDYYVKKFGLKMRGSTWSTAKGWVEGIGTLNQREKTKLLERIRDKYYKFDFNFPMRFHDDWNG